mmetsp:Transcript_4326/g.4442  ORF Transcript_4326/g.4442 Transcript_4326/m.4442 type:complete len:451 (-) Transcript_4326:339-1691(-)|eukprot:CAMPEP_0182426584 /NCGR_PEP_ID=MMETSP1167-20130531/13088_1 /TAXON_ID=2988 /ORGANISM="Mallomonas Sp, Strain CCMP3275" /LENGTH=450 /DNA_ID=CAMNT_0024608127 /DNA_START=102 /DNA_END=1454 /DNA_ORIENTATION=+
MASNSWQSANLLWQVGKDTDIGGGRENQDDYFIFEKKEHNLCVICILDGHGRDVGKTASNAGRKFMVDYFEAHMNDLMTKPYETLVEVFKGAHEHIKVAFRQKLTEQGFEVQDAPEGYLLKRKRGGSNWACVHGGTSCSLLAIVGSNMYIANVGDSSGLLCSVVPNLDPSSMKHLGDSALQALKPLGPPEPGASPTSTLLSTPTITPTSSLDMSVTDSLVLTAEHSPEAPSEFLRFRATRPSPTDPQYPEILILYDSPSHDKSQCPPVFELNGSGVPTVTGRGKYYKNVRQEWASLVSTPPTARFQDALAFTRSLGDFHLHTYGVSNLPEIQILNISTILEAMSVGSVPIPTPTGSVVSPMLSVVLASDGVWDNFLYPDVTKFVIDPSCIGAVIQDTQGAQRVASSFMQRNMTRSRSNFGSQADNATVVVMYLCSTAQPAFPVEGFGKSP